MHDMRVLLTFIGFHDPSTIGLIGQEEQPGPILSLVGVQPFDHIILFSNPNRKEGYEHRPALELVQSIKAKEERIFELLPELEAMLSEGNNGQA